MFWIKQTCLAQQGKELHRTKNSEIQRRYYTKKRKRKIGTKSLQKPPMDEVIVCKQKLNQMETEICSICFCEDDTLLHEHVDWLACTMCQVLLSFVMTFFS